MPARWVKPNPNAVKLNYSYSVRELATCCGVHPHTVRNWQGKGLEPIDKARPVLFQGAAVRAFLSRRKASRRCPLPPGTLFCVRWHPPTADGASDNGKAGLLDQRNRAGA